MSLPSLFGPSFQVFPALLTSLRKYLYTPFLVCRVGVGGMLKLPLLPSLVLSLSSTNLNLQGPHYSAFVHGVPQNVS